MNKEQISRLRATPVGGMTRIDGISLKVMLSSLKSCRERCEFRGEGGAKCCEAAKACMLHLRPDRQSVYFKRINTKEGT